MDGVELAAIYSYQPNHLGYCGSSSFASAYQSRNPEMIKEELKKFHAHYAYLRLIGRENNLDPFHRDVVKAFWIGNWLLDTITHDTLQNFIENELFPDKTCNRAKKLAKDLPEGLVPHHSFNSLYINFISDAVEKTTANYDSCCVTFGKLISVSEKTATIRRNYISEGPVLRQKTEKISIDRFFTGQLQPGDLVSVHWGHIIQILQPSDYSSLEKYTLKNINILSRG